MPEYSVDDDPIVLNWSFRQGNDVSRRFRLSAIVNGETTYWNLSSYTIEGQVRAAPGEDVLGTITGTPAENQTNDRGVFTLSIPSEETAAFPRKCVADVKFIDGDGVETTLIAVKFTVSRAVTVLEP
jgi:hypothetical protein